MCETGCGKPPNDPVRQPVINSPYEFPCWHYRVDSSGVAIRGDASPGRRLSEAYLSPVPLPMGYQQVLSGTQDPLSSMDHIKQVRQRVENWRRDGYPDVTDVTHTLLRYWEDPERSIRLYFAQLDAIRTLVYLAEAAPKDTLHNFLDAVNAEYNDNMRRWAVKMATGVGKTVVMAMTVLWQAANRWEYPSDDRFTNRFVAIAPGITVRDRLLSGLRADSTDQKDVYSEMDLLPPVGEYRKRVNSAQIEVINFQNFVQKNVDMMGVSSVGKVISGYRDRRETPNEALVRALGDLFEYGHDPVMALNDEGHHCYKRGGEGVEGKEAMVWYSGIHALHRASRLHSVVDFSATPSFISGDRKQKGKLFPWVVSDYSIVDAIEAGIVKIPRAPVSDNLSQEEVPIYRDIYNQTKDSKGPFSEHNVNSDLESALRTMYDDYERESRDWERYRNDSKVPAFVVVANSIANANGLFRYIGGYEQEDSISAPGQLGELLSNCDANGKPHAEPRTILMHSKMESSEGDLSATLAKSIRGLAELYRERFPNAVLSEDRRDKRKLFEGDDREVLRRVLNTVGKPGEPGARVRCVVSVGMITEGWDARTVTHMVGFRAFGSQLLCEQVGGRTLRRRIYEVDDDTKRFEPEFSTVVGVPWSYVPAGGDPGTPDPDESVVTHTIRLVPERAKHRVRWPNVIGYDAFGGDDELIIGVENWNDVPSLELIPVTRRRTRIGATLGPEETLSANPVDFRRIAFLASAQFVGQIAREHDNAANFDNATLFRKSLSVIENARTRRLLSTHDGDVYTDASPGEASELADWLEQATRAGARARVRQVQVVLDDNVEWRFTAPFEEYETRRKDVCETQKSEISHAVCDSGWEVQVAQALDLRDDVSSWVRNERLGWQIPWFDENSSVWRRYHPDFVARVNLDDGNTLNLVIEVKGEERSDDLVKKKYAEEYWIPGVNAHPDIQKYGRWEYIYVTHPSNLGAMIDQVKGESIG